MSRTQSDSGPESPVKKYVSFKGSTGKLRYWDKESEENVELDSIEFVVLDTKASISGFNENESCGINSNLIGQFELGRKELVVKTKVNKQFGEFARGLYRDIKDKCFSIGGKFTTNIFALADLGDGMEIIRIDLSGASLGPWIEFNNELKKSGVKIYDLTITIEKGVLCGRKDGQNYNVSKTEYNKVLKQLKADPMASKPVWFRISKFSSETISEEMVLLAEDQDVILQGYLKGTPSEPQPQERGIAEELEPVSENNQPDDLPF